MIALGLLAAACAGACVGLLLGALLCARKVLTLADRAAALERDNKRMQDAHRAIVSRCLHLVDENARLRIWSES